MGLFRMRFQYTTNSPLQSELDSLPRVPLTLICHDKKLQVNGLLDSGATVNFLPYSIGVQLGELWNDNKAVIRLAGSIGKSLAQPLPIIAHIADFQPVKLVFAWIRNDNSPLILGQMNFFMEFDVCFFRSKLEFEIKKHS
jgi:hypothetical protein